MVAIDPIVQTNRAPADAPSSRSRGHLLKLMSSEVWKGALGGTNTVLSRT